MDQALLKPVVVEEDEGPSRGFRLRTSAGEDLIDLVHFDEVEADVIARLCRVAGVRSGAAQEARVSGPLSRSGDAWSRAFRLSQVGLEMFERLIQRDFHGPDIVGGVGK